MSFQPSRDRQSVAESEILNYYQTTPSRQSTPERPGSRSRPLPRSNFSRTTVHECPKLALNTSGRPTALSTAVVRGISTRLASSRTPSQLSSSTYSQSGPPSASSIYPEYVAYSFHPSPSISSTTAVRRVIPTQTRQDTRRQGLWLREGSMRTMNLKKVAKGEKMEYNMLEKACSLAEKQRKKAAKTEAKALARR